MLKNIARIGSTLSTSLMGFMMSSSVVGNDITVQAGGTLLGGLLGGAVAFKIIPSLLKGEMIKTSIVLGLGMACLWTLSGDWLYAKAVSKRIEEVDPRYKKLVEEYKKIDIGNKIDVKSIELKLDLLNDSHSNTINSLNDSVYRELVSIKNSDLTAWKNGLYIEIAKQNNCSTPNRISFNRLVECKVLNDKFLLNKEFNKKREEFEKEIIEAKANNSKIEESKDEVRKLKTKIKAIKQEATKKSEDAKQFIFYAFLIAGLTVEVILVMWDEVIEYFLKNKEIKRIEDKYEEAKQNQLKNFFIDYANNTESNKKATLLNLELREKRKGYLGKRLALSNSIVGAFLYASAYNLKHWRDLTQSNILYVNGLAGVEKTSMGERKKLIESFMIEDKEVVALGSTATVLKNKAILKKGKKFIVPQKEVIDFLVNLEDNNPLMSPRKIDIDNAIEVIKNYIMFYYPNQFD